jgi:hypothetical protein
VEKWNKIIHRQWGTQNCGKKVFHSAKTFHRGNRPEMEG